MPSVEELLSVAEVDANTISAMDSRIEIDADTRIIRMMPQDELFGVESDEKSERKYFKVHKIVGNGVDLSKLQLRINYQNASKTQSGKDMYIVTDATVYNDEWVYFSWELSRKVTQYKGNIYFIVCAVKADSNGNITNEWNTTLAEGKVLEGLEVETSQEQQYQASDYLEQLKQQLLDYSKEIKDTFPSDYTQMQDDIGSLKSDLNQLKETANLDNSYSEKNCNVQGFYPASSNVNGLGFLMKNVPNFIHSVNAECELTGNGVVKLDILDASKNEIFSTAIDVTDYSSGVKLLIFNVNEYIYEEKIWIRIHSETLGIGRVEPSSINKKVVDISNTYAAYLVNGNWNYESFYNYIPYCTINGFSTKKSLFVGEKHEFKKIKDAVDYANEHISNGWDIFIESGTYDIYSELGGDAWYSAITPSKGNMQGLSLGNNVNIIGIGNVKLTLNAPDNLATSSNVPNLSVIELQNKNNTIENINIECKNVRYGIHDETDGGRPNSKRYLKNVEITHNGVVSGTWESAVSYGSGSSDNSYFEYENCKFNNGWLAHQSNKQTIPPNFIATNCIFSGGSYAVSLNTSGTCKANITFNNCEINYMVRILESSDVWSIYGSGNNLFNYVVIGNNKINSQPFNLYDLTRIFKNIGINKISKGNVVSVYKSGVSNANDAKQVIGIALNNADPNENVRVQLSGYYDCYGVAPFSENNTLLGVSNGAIIEDASNYFGIGVYVDDMQQIYLLK